jgi:hypothetical protein
VTTVRRRRFGRDAGHIVRLDVADAAVIVLKPTLNVQARMNGARQIKVIVSRSLGIERDLKYSSPALLTDT